MGSLDPHDPLPEGAGGGGEGVLAAGLFALAVFLVSVWVRLDGLDLVLTADEGYWVNRTVRFAAGLAAGDLTATFRTGHPGVSVMWVGLIGIGPARIAPFLSEQYESIDALERAPGYEALAQAARRAVVFVVAGLMATIALLGWRLLGPGPALVGGVLLTLDPYVVGMTRLLHVDALLAPLMAISALAGLLYWTRSRRWPYLLLSGVAGGLALLTKAPAGYLPIFFALVGAVMLVDQHRRSAGRLSVPSALGSVVAWGVVAGVVYVLLFPALWEAPVQRIGNLITFLVRIGLEPHPSNFFLGQATQGDPGLLYYLVVMPLRASPVALMGVAALALRSVEGERRWASCWLVVYAVFFAVLMTIGAKKLDRYMLPVLLVLDLLAGVGLWRLATHLSEATVGGSGYRLGRPLLPRCGVCLVGQLALLVLARPYPIAFYNPVAGGPRRAANLIMVGWGEGLEQVTAFLNGQPGADGLLVATNYIHVVQPRFVGRSIPVNLYFAEGDGTPLPTPDYVVLYVNSVQRRQIPPLAQRAVQAGPPAFVARINDLEYAWVYAVPASEPRVNVPVPGQIDVEREDQ